MSTPPLKQLIEDPRTGLISAQKLHKKYPQFTIREIQDAMNQQPSYQVNQFTRKPKQYTSIQANHAGDSVQVDLMDVSYSTTAIHGTKYLLTFIDVYSRFAQVIPIRNKTATTVAKAMKKHLDSFPRKVYNVTSDDGSEFKAKAFQKLMEERGIKHYITPAHTPNKVAIVERFHRTLRSRLKLFTDMRKTERFTEILPDLVYNYNNTFHRTIKATPQEVLSGDEQPANTPTVVDYPFKLGDIVRRSVTKQQFAKGGRTFSHDTYIITGINEYSFQISNQRGEELNRAYQGYELKRVPDATSKSHDSDALTNDDSDEVILELSSDEDETKPEVVKRTARKRYKQKRDPAFNDKNTHRVDDEGNVTITRRHLIPKHAKRVSKRPQRD